MNELILKNVVFDAPEFLNLKREFSLTITARYYGGLNSSFDCATDLTPYGLGDFIYIDIECHKVGSSWVHTVTIAGDYDTVIFDDTGNNEDYNELGNCYFEEWVVTPQNQIDLFMWLVRNNYAEEQDAGYIHKIDLYLLNDEKDHINKNLVYVGGLDGNYNDDVDIMNLSLIIDNYQDLEEFNYIYVRDLNRYYYVDKPVHISKELTQLNLSEDVLMSHRELILRQSVYISRSENYGDDDKIDNEVSTDYNKVISEEIITPTNEIFDDTGCFIISVINDLVLV